ncbi:hypothetical protein DFH07DRAFT_954387 [Mycena maculata]|uniref:Uncharacterized protein n=1 Tax=Mycena maculata TaxID=230809 RepID=A0AAD7NNR9_9AGAR|nr:hypothetical protein DFH07DRAFT_954387 [Mycena maculata]
MAGEYLRLHGAPADPDAWEDFRAGTIPDVFFPAPQPATSGMPASASTQAMYAPLPVLGAGSPMLGTNTFSPRPDGGSARMVGLLDALGGHEMLAPPSPRAPQQPRGGLAARMLWAALEAEGLSRDVLLALDPHVVARSLTLFHRAVLAQAPDNPTPARTRRPATVWERRCAALAHEAAARADPGRGHELGDGAGGAGGGAADDVVREAQVHERAAGIVVQEPARRTREAGTLAVRDVHPRAAAAQDDAAAAPHVDAVVRAESRGGRILARQQPIAHEHAFVLLAVPDAAQLDAPRLAVPHREVAPRLERGGAGVVRKAQADGGARSTRTPAHGGEGELGEGKLSVGPAAKGEVGATVREDILATEKQRNLARAGWRGEKDSAVTPRQWDVIGAGSDGTGRTTDGKKASCDRRWVVGGGKLAGRMYSANSRGVGATMQVRGFGIDADNARGLGADRGRRRNPGKRDLPQPTSLLRRQHVQAWAARSAGKRIVRCECSPGEDWVRRLKVWDADLLRGGVETAGRSTCVPATRARQRRGGERAFGDCKGTVSSMASSDSRRRTEPPSEEMEAAEQSNALAQAIIGETGFGEAKATGWAGSSDVTGRHGEAHR